MPEKFSNGYERKTCSLACHFQQRFGRSPDDPKETERGPDGKWRRTSEGNRRKNHKRRGGLITDPVPYTIAEIAARDGYCCGICSYLVDMTLSPLDELGPTIDHVVPLKVSRDDRRTNVQLAHRVCNTRKGSKIVA